MKGRQREVWWRARRRRCQCGNVRLSVANHNPFPQGNYASCYPCLGLSPPPTLSSDPSQAHHSPLQRTTFHRQPSERSWYLDTYHDTGGRKKKKKKRCAFRVPAPPKRFARSGIRPNSLIPVTHNKYPPLRHNPRAIQTVTGCFSTKLSPTTET